MAVVRRRKRKSVLCRTQLNTKTAVGMDQQCPRLKSRRSLLHIEMIFRRFPNGAGIQDKFYSVLRISGQEGDPRGKPCAMRDFVEAGSDPFSDLSFCHIGIPLSIFPSNEYTADSAQ